MVDGRTYDVGIVRHASPSVWCFSGPVGRRETVLLGCIGEMEAWCGREVRRVL